MVKSISGTYTSILQQMFFTTVTMVFVWASDQSTHVLFNFTEVPYMVPFTITDMCHEITVNYFLFEKLSICEVHYQILLFIT